MTALLGALWSRVAAWAAGAGAGLALLAGLWVAARRQGREEAEHDAAERDLESRRARDAVERAVARRADPRADLLRDWRRGE